MPSKPFISRRAAHLRLGRRGERVAARFLEAGGIEILVRNYTCAAGEIDLVGREANGFCFVEVKTRRRVFAGRPADAVGAEKRRRIVRAAHRYLREIGWPPVPHRYDIVEIVLAGGRVAAIHHWRNAFTEEKRPFDRRFPSALDDDSDLAFDDQGDRVAAAEAKRREPMPPSVPF